MKVESKPAKKSIKLVMIIELDSHYKFFQQLDITRLTNFNVYDCVENSIDIFVEHIKLISKNGGLCFLCIC